MSKTVIKIENLSKVYRLGQIGTGTLSHDLNRWWQMNIRGKEDPFAKIGHLNDRTAKAQKGELVAALSDINLEVKQGDILGIIGRNGAGKSTLLKILSRVTSPTTGSIKTIGRMASLLEVGTGFHPEMTGRENIYMNGTIMGMRKWEIDKQLDAIVDFAGVAKYIDTPVKRYSSGMTVRLGFAIAAHLEPEILVVDEVLSVGDAEFQKKAIGKMQDVSSKDGRTVLFVSHSMGTISKLCNNTLLLKNGTIENYGLTQTIIDLYLNDSSNNEELIYSKTNSKKAFYIQQVQPMFENNVCHEFAYNTEILLKITIQAINLDPSAQFSLTILDLGSRYISTKVVYINELKRTNDKLDFVISLPPSIIAPNKYSFRAALYNPTGEVYDLVENICPISIYDTGSEMIDFENYNYGCCLLNFKLLDLNQ